MGNVSGGAVMKRRQKNDGFSRHDRPKGKVEFDSRESEGRWRCFVVLPLR